MQEATTEDADRSSHVFTEASIQELENMRGEEYSVVGRIVHQGIETLSEDVEDLVYVARVLSENQGLLVLLLGGVSSMVLALVVGLDDVSVMKALLFSVTCYGITTVLVARSAQRYANRISNLCDLTPRLSSTEVAQIIEAIHEETFVRDDELKNCDLPRLRKMLNSRMARVPPQDAVTGIEVSECLSQELETKKKNLIAELQLRRKYNESCCICLEKFIPGDKIRVLPGCRHEFHNKCIDEWAMTFAEDKIKMRINCYVKSGNPSCPLCKTTIGNA